MSRLDQLIQRAKKSASIWRPFQYTIRPLGNRYHVFRCLWNGVEGSLRPGEPEKHGVNPHSERYFDTEEQAVAAVKADIASFERKFDIEIASKVLVFNLCPPSDREQKEMWLRGSGTSIEYLADRAGLGVEDYIRKEFGPPKFSEEYLAEQLARHADVIRWRREEGMDVEETAADVNAERGTAGGDKNG